MKNANGVLGNVATGVRDQLAGRGKEFTQFTAESRDQIMGRLPTDAAPAASDLIGN